MDNDILARLLADVEEKQKSGMVAIIKTADGYKTIPRSSVDEDYGDLELVTEATDKSAPVYTFKVSAEDKAAQETRSTNWDIGIKDSGSVTVPKKWKDAGLAFEDFADPVNCKFPIHDEDHVRNAIARWGNDDIRKQYSSSEQSIVGKRIMDAAKKFKIEVDEDTFGKSSSKGATDVKIGGETFRRTEKTDTLGRATYRFEYGDVGEDPKQFGFVHDNTVAQLVLPKSASDEEGRRLIGLLAQAQKSAAPTRQKGDSVDDLKESLDNAIESAGTNAMSSCWWAFLSVATDMWGDGGFSDGLGDGDFPQLVSALSDALNETYQKFKDAGNDRDMLVAIIDARKHARLAIRGAQPVEKAGATHSRKTREKLEAIRSEIDELLGTDKEDKGADLPSGANKGVGASRNPGSDTSEVLLALKETRAEVERLKAKQADLDAAADDFRRKIAERDAIIDEFGRKPLDDPMRAPGQPAAPPDGEVVDKQASLAGGVSIYDWMRDQAH